MLVVSCSDRAWSNMEIRESTSFIPYSSRDNVIDIEIMTSMESTVDITSMHIVV
jgi:hypothetical protein